MRLADLVLPLLLACAANVSACTHAHPPIPVTTPPPAQPPACVTAVTPLIPREATSSLFVRPREMFEHPRVGRALGHALADDGEQALMRRSQRLGYDIRTVDRAVIAWTPRGWMALGLGSFDGAQIIERLWDRMLTPRRRGALGPRALRAEGMIAEVPVAVAIEQACGVAAYAEVDTRRCDRAIATPSTTPGEDPSVWLEWRAHGVPDALAEGDALIHRMHELTLTARPHPDGVTLRLTLSGEAPADGPQRLRRAAQAFAASELGDLIGANDWLAGDQATIEGDSREIRVSLMIPFRGLDALAEVVRGRMGGL